ncbi:MAG: hypothetical protein U0174_16090 [Polyangiaceae bacterium]
MLKRHNLIALSLLSLLAFGTGCAAQADDESDDDTSEDALTAALPQPLYDCDVSDRTALPGPTLPQHALVVPQGKKAVVELTRVLGRSLGDSGWTGTSTANELDESSTLKKAGKVVTISASGYALTIDTGAKTTSPYYGGAALKGTLTEGTKTYPTTCRAISQKAWFEDTVHTTTSPSETAHGIAIDPRTAPEAVRTKLEEARKSIDADIARAGVPTRSKAKSYAVYYTSSKKTPAGYVSWAVERSSNPDAVLTYWTIGTTVSGKEIYRALRDTL